MPKKSPKKFHNTKKTKIKNLSGQETKNVLLQAKKNKPLAVKNNKLNEKETVLITQSKPAFKVDTSKNLDIKETNIVQGKKPLSVISENLAEKTPYKVKRLKLIIIFIIITVILGGILFTSTKINWSKFIDLLKKPITKVETSLSGRTVSWDEFEKKSGENSNNDNTNDSDGTDSSNNNNDNNNENNNGNVNSNNETDNPYTSALLTEVKNTLSSIQGEIDNLDVENLAQPDTYEF